MKVYVAASSNDRQLARGFMQDLASASIELTLDWTRSEGYDRPFTEEENAEQAFLDLKAVREADLVWIILSETKSEGAHAELGGALMLGKTVIVSGVIGPNRIFPYLAAERYDSHEVAKARIIEGHDRRKLWLAP